MPAAATGGLKDKTMLSTRSVDSSGHQIDLRNKDRGGGRSGVLHSFGNIRKHGEAEVLLSSLLGVCATNNLGT